MQPSQHPLFYVMVWDKLANDPSATTHPDFERYFAYPVLYITKDKQENALLLLPDDRHYFRYLLAAQCTLCDDGLMWKKDGDTPPRETV